MFVLGHYLFLDAHRFPRVSLSENCSHLGSDNVRGQISVPISATYRGYCLHIPRWYSSVSKAYVQYDNFTFKISFSVTERLERRRNNSLYVKIVAENTEKCRTPHTANVQLIVNILSRARQKYFNDSKYSSNMFFLGTDHVRGKISEHIFVVSRSYGTNVIRRRIGINQNEKALSGTWTPQSMFKTVYLELKTWFRMQFSVNEHEKISLAFEKTTKFHEPVGRVRLVVFKKITSAYLHQIAREIMLLLINSLHEKGITDSQDRRNFDSARYLSVWSRVTTLHSFHKKNTLVFGQSEARNFFKHIITWVIRVGNQGQVLPYYFFWTVIDVNQLNNFIQFFSWKVLKGNQHSLHFSF